jgi:hypothetical protein
MLQHMRFSPRSPALWIIGGGLVILCLIGVLLNGRISGWIAGDGFRQMLNKETSKGMKFNADYSSLQRVGLLGLHGDSFHGTNGYKTIVSMDAKDITGWFQPLGIGLRRWQLEDLHMKSGTVWLQKTEATPGEPKGVPPVPWWGLFWPYRVYLSDVKVDDADVLFKLQDKESGIYHTFLEVTPNGRDFEYDGKGGQFKTPMTPALNLQHVHLLIRKPRLYCPEFVLGDDTTHPEEQMQITGDAGLQDDRSIHILLKMLSMQVAPFLPEKMRDHVAGHANGNFEYHSTGSGLETASGKGSFDLPDVVLHDFPLVKQYVTLTSSPDPGDLHLQVCRADVRWEQGAISLENIKVRCDGVFKLEGNLKMAKDKTLSGEVQLGLTEPYLRWLPTAKTAIFTESDGEYRTTTVHISGTSEKPVQDLSPRVTRQIEKSPLVAVKLFFNAL